MEGASASLHFVYEGEGKVAFYDSLAPVCRESFRDREAEEHWQRDLAKAGFERQRMGCYFCSPIRAHATLHILLELG